MFWKKILDGLEKLDQYNKMVDPFLQKGLKPNLTWKTNDQAWQDGQYSGAYTTFSKDSFTGMSSDIYLNSKMLEKGSSLLIAAVTIHETYHAYINYMFANEQRPDLVDKSSASYMAGFYQMVIFDKNSNKNYTDRYNMLTSQFDNMTIILYDYNREQVSIDDCRKALLFGMDNPGDFPTPEQKSFITQAYNDILSKYGYNHETVNNFTLHHINATPTSFTAKTLGASCN